MLNQFNNSESNIPNNGMFHHDTNGPSRKADDKKPKKKRNHRVNDVSNDIPVKYKCQLTQRPMTEPVKSIYGHNFEKSAILGWLNQQGRICPLTGTICIV